MPQTFEFDSDNWFRVLGPGGVGGVTNAKDGTVISNATVTLDTLTNRAGVAVVGSFPYTLAPVSGSPGVYEVLLPHDLPITRGTVYTASVTIDGGAGLYRTMQETVVVEV